MTPNSRAVLTRALEHSHGTHAIEDVEYGIANGDLQLWEGGESAVVTELQKTPRVQILHIFLAGGKLPELEKMWPVIREWGKGMGCTRATLRGRPGWARSFLANVNWRPVAVEMGTEL